MKMLTRIISLSLLDFTGRPNLLVFKTWSACLAETPRPPTSRTVSNATQRAEGLWAFLKTFLHWANGTKSLSTAGLRVCGLLSGVQQDRKPFCCVSQSANRSH